MRILFITNKDQCCGVADYGRRLFAILKDHLNITLCETNEQPDDTGYDVLLYNYHYATIPFVKKESIKQVVLFHEAHLNFQPDVVVNVAELPRPLFENINLPTFKNEITIIGSFGFGFPDKNFPGIATLVKQQFENAIIRLNIPFAEYGDKFGYLAKQEVEKCREILEGTNIELMVTHEFMAHETLLQWLNQNDINVFLYNPSQGRGISSATDYALSARKPIGVSSSEMFRHLPKEICLDNKSIPELLQSGTDPLRKVYEDNTNEKLIDMIKHYVAYK